jgi:hypothetical protein
MTDEFKKEDRLRAAAVAGHPTTHKLPFRRASRVSKRPLINVPFGKEIAHAKVIRAMFVPPQFPSGYRGYAKNETAAKALVRKEWERYRTPRGAPRFTVTPIEMANASGVPDWHVHDALWNTMCWIEVKHFTMPARWPTHGTVDMGLRPEQAVWLWQWRTRASGFAGVLAFSPGEWWVWLPARVWADWPQRMTVPNGWLICPWIMGSGPVPSPPELFALRADFQLFYQFMPPSKAHYFKATGWPNEHGLREGDQMRREGTMPSSPDLDPGLPALPDPSANPPSDQSPDWARHQRAVNR